MSGNGSDLAGVLDRAATKLGCEVAERPECPVPPVHQGDPLLNELVYSFLLWESGAERAQRAFAAIHRSFVDYNELRVCLVDELRAAIGKTYPKSEPRVIALRDALNSIFEARNSIGLVHLNSAGKREVRQFFDGIPSAPAFVSSRVSLLAGAHAFPLDNRLHTVACELIDDGSIDASETPEATAARIERALRAGEALRAYSILESAAAMPASERAERFGSSRSGRSGGRAGSRAAGSKSSKQRARTGADDASS